METTTGIATEPIPEPTPEAIPEPLALAKVRATRVRPVAAQTRVPPAVPAAAQTRAPTANPLTAAITAIARPTTAGTGDPARIPTVSRITNQEDDYRKAGTGDPLR